LGIQQVRNDPKHQASLRSAVDLGSSLTLDAQLRYVGRRPQPRVPGYVELNASLGWQLNNRIALSLTGANLLHKSHVEYVTPGANRIPRRVMVGIQWTP
jgi:iron complex outermembrane recepter protein